MNVESISQLRLKEEALIAAIREEVQIEEADARVAYLPNLLPLQQADFIIVAMEPSLAWDKKGNDQSAAEKVRGGYRNFMHSWEDFILHYSLAHYLGPHYLTDVSKAAMTVKQAVLWRRKLYPRWVTLLREEISLVASPTAKIVPLGADVEAYLQSVALPYPLSPRILHFSIQAAAYRKACAEKYPEEYAQFRTQISQDALLDFAEKQLRAYFQAEQVYLGNAMPETLIGQTLQRLKANRGLNETRVQLLFTYFKQFGELKASDALPAHA